MFPSLSIEGYRGFKKFSIPELGRINLLVGHNNCGKTSILEAIQLAAAVGEFDTIHKIASRRGEYRSGRAEMVEPSHFFWSHQFGPFSQIQVALEPAVTFVLKSVLNIPEGSTTTTASPPTEFSSTPLSLHFEWTFTLPLGHSSPVSYEIPLDLDDGIDRRRLLPRRLAGVSALPPPVVYLPTAGFSPSEVITKFESVVLTDEEVWLTKVLQSIEPNLLRLAITSGDPIRSPRARGGIHVRMADSRERIPIGSLGDGMWRLLGIALALVSAQDGILLIDEIDTGLHYTTLEKMWTLVNEASKRLNVQVFATTHSRDCYESLASICREDVTENSEVMVHRIEPGRDTAVSYSEAEIVSASMHNTEVR